MTSDVVRADARTELFRWIVGLGLEPYAGAILDPLETLVALHGQSSAARAGAPWAIRNLLRLLTRWRPTTAAKAPTKGTKARSTSKKTTEVGAAPPPYTSDLLDVDVLREIADAVAAVGEIADIDALEALVGACGPAERLAAGGTTAAAFAEGLEAWAAGWDPESPLATYTLWSDTDSAAATRTARITALLSDARSAVGVPVTGPAVVNVVRDGDAVELTLDPVPTTAPTIVWLETGADPAAIRVATETTLTEAGAVRLTPGWARDWRGWVGVGIASGESWRLPAPPASVPVCWKRAGLDFGATSERPAPAIAAARPRALPTSALRVRLRVDPEETLSWRFRAPPADPVTLAAERATRTGAEWVVDPPEPEAGWADPVFLVPVRVSLQGAELEVDPAPVFSRENQLGATLLRTGADGTALADGAALHDGDTLDLTLDASLAEEAAVELVCVSDAGEVTLGQWTEPPATVRIGVEEKDGVPGLRIGDARYEVPGEVRLQARLVPGYGAATVVALDEALVLEARPRVPVVLLCPAIDGTRADATAARRALDDRLAALGRRSAYLDHRWVPAAAVEKGATIEALLAALELAALERPDLSSAATWVLVLPSGTTWESRPGRLARRLVVASASALATGSVDDWIPGTESPFRRRVFVGWQPPDTSCLAATTTTVGERDVWSVAGGPSDAELATPGTPVPFVRPFPTQPLLLAFAPAPTESAAVRWQGTSRPATGDSVSLARVALDATKPPEALVLPVLVGGLGTPTLELGADASASAGLALFPGDSLRVVPAFLAPRATLLVGDRVLAKWDTTPPATLTLRVVEEAGEIVVRLDGADTSLSWTAGTVVGGLTLSVDPGYGFPVARWSRSDLRIARPNRAALVLVGFSRDQAARVSTWLRGQLFAPDVVTVPISVPEATTPQAMLRALYTLRLRSVGLDGVWLAHWKGANATLVHPYGGRVVVADLDAVLQKPFADLAGPASTTVAFDGLRLVCRLADRGPTAPGGRRYELRLEPPRRERRSVDAACLQGQQPLFADLLSNGAQVARIPLGRPSADGDLPLVGFLPASPAFDRIDVRLDAGAGSDQDLLASLVTVPSSAPDPNAGPDTLGWRWRGSTPRPWRAAWLERRVGSGFLSVALSRAESGSFAVTGGERLVVSDGWNPPTEWTAPGTSTSVPAVTVEDWSAAPPWEGLRPIVVFVPWVRTAGGWVSAQAAWAKFQADNPSARAFRPALTPDFLCVVDESELSTGSVLEQLELLAAASEGLADMAWLVVLPDLGESLQIEDRPSPAAWRLCVAREGKLGGLYEHLLKASRASAGSTVRGPAVRVLGSVSEDGVAWIDDLRHGPIERWPATDGALEVGGEPLSLVLLDEDDEEVCRRDVSSVRGTLPARFVAVLEDEADRTRVVELRKGDTVLRRLTRPPRPRIDVGPLQVPPGMQPLTVEGGAGPAPGAAMVCIEEEWLGRPVRYAAGLASRYTRRFFQPLERKLENARVSMELRFGWDTIRTSPVETAGDPSPATIRRFGAGWVLVANDGSGVVTTVDWDFDGTPMRRAATGDVFTLPSNARGVLEATWKVGADSLALTRTLDATADYLPMLPELPAVVVSLADADAEIVRLLDNSWISTGVQFTPVYDLPGRLSGLGRTDTAVESVRHPLVGRLRERVTLQAALSSGAEEATWLVVVPSGDNARWYDRSQVPFARDVVVTTVPALREVLAKLAPRAAEPLPPSEALLCVIGRVDEAGRAEIVRVRRARRRHFPPPPSSLGLTVCLLTKDGVRVATADAYAAVTERPCTFFAVLPDVDDGHWVELWYERRYVPPVRLHLYQRGGDALRGTRPELSLTFDGHRLRWRPAPGDWLAAVRSWRVSLRVLSLETQVATLPPHAREVELPRWSHASWDEVILEADDGWDHHAWRSEIATASPEACRMRLERPAADRVVLELGRADASVWWTQVPPPPGRAPSAPDGGGGEVRTARDVRGDATGWIEACAFVAGERPADVLGPTGKDPVAAGGWARCAAATATGWVLGMVDGSLHGWAAADPRPERTDPVVACAVDGDMLVVGTLGGTLCSGPNPPRVLARLTTNEWRNLSVNAAHDRIIAITDDDELWCWTGGRAVQLVGELPFAWAAVASDGAVVAVDGRGGGMRFPAGAASVRWTGPTLGRFGAAAIDPDGRWLLVALGGAGYLLSLDAPEAGWKRLDVEGEPVSVGFVAGATGPRPWIVREDGTVRVYEDTAARAYAVWPSDAWAGTAVATSRWLVVPRTATTIRRHAWTGEHTDHELDRPIRALVPHRDGERVLVLYEPRSVRLSLDDPDDAAR